MQSGTLLYFISTDAGKLSLQPLLQLEPTDLHRLQRYMACIALRHQGCSETMKGSAEAKRKDSMSAQATELSNRESTLQR